MSGDHNMYGDGTVYRGDRSKDSAVPTYTVHELAHAKGVPSLVTSAMLALNEKCAEALDKLEALEHHVEQTRPIQRTAEAVTALREALEQPQKTNQCGEVCERAKLCATCAQGLKPDQASEPVAWIANGWSVFNTGAEVASGLSLNEAMDYLTDERAAREWSVVCVINKDNMPTRAAPQPARQPISALPDGDIVFFSDRGDAVSGYSAQRVWEILLANGIEGEA